jgi:predicted RNase H-like HicB family nuclease
MKTTTALIEMGEDGTYTIFSAETNSVILGEGDTVAEAKKDFENSLKEVYELYEDRGEEPPDDLKDVEFEYKYDLPSFFRCYSLLNASELARKIGINASLMRQYKRGIAPISNERIGTIEKAINELGRELTAVRF